MNSAKTEVLVNHASRNMNYAILGLIALVVAIFIGSRLITSNTTPPAGYMPTDIKFYGTHPRERANMIAQCGPAPTHNVDNVTVACADAWTAQAYLDGKMVNAKTGKVATPPPGFIR